MSSNPQKPTMADVAREAGVAIGTVSRVVNGEAVGEVYQKKVTETIERLGYKYNNMGRVLRTNQTNTIAMIIPNTLNPYFAMLVHHINAALEKRNYKMMLCFTEYDRQREWDMIQMVRQKRADGIIALTYHPDLNMPTDIPVVSIDRFFSVSIPCVAADNFGGGRMAAHKLKELGCQKVAHMRIISTLINEPSKRKDGFISGCMECDMDYECMLLHDGEAYAKFEEFIRANIHEGRFAFDGLFIGTDSLAWRIVQILRKLHIRVPQDVQVIGFDGLRMFGDQEYIVSSIVQPIEDIAEVCVETVLSKDRSVVHSLTTLPVHYAKGPTTRDIAKEDPHASMA